MLASISPLGQRARAGSWWRAAIAFLTGSVVAAGAAGAALGGLGQAAGLGRPDARGWVLAVLAGAAVVGGLLDRRGQVPGVRRQVDEAWLVAYRDWVYGFGYGFQLGLGVVTIVTSAAVYLAGLFALATGSVLLGGVVGAGFGVARAAMLWMVADVRTTSDLVHRLAVVDRLRPSIAGATAGFQWLVAAGLAAAAVAAFAGADAASVATRALH